MKYRVVNKFIDTKDNNTLYEVGDIYPKTDYKPTKTRIAELSKKHKKYNCVFIEPIEETKEEPSSKK